MNRISEITTEEWNKVYPDVLEGHSFFKTMDDSKPGQFSMRCIMVSIYTRNFATGPSGRYSTSCASSLSSRISNASLAKAAKRGASRTNIEKGV